LGRRSQKLILALFFALLFPVYSSAAVFSLSVRPYEGGYDLRYGKINPSLGRVNRELTVNIDSDIGKQYRLVQTLLEPLMNAQGDTIALNNIYVYGIRSSNKTGTLQVEEGVTASLGRQVIYTSSTSGESDAFTLVYGINLSNEVKAGSYRGRLSFSLEPIGSEQSSVNSILNVFVDVDIESSIKISTPTGSKSIVLKPAKEGEDPATDVIFEIQGGLGSQFRIIQIAGEQPVTADGLTLDYGCVNFIGRDATKGMVINELTDLSDKQQIIYTSSLSGEADSFIISYRLAAGDQKAGRYRTNLKYLLEIADVSSNRVIDSVILEIDNPRIFDLVVSSDTGGLVQFRDIKPLQLPKKSEVTINVNSNIGKKYQVSQKVNSDLTNKEGDVIQEKNFTLTLESLSTKGQFKVADKSAVSKGESLLMVSDSVGSSDKFKINYELSLPADYRAGDYSTRITYSLSEI
jgi:hypothetical protein